MYRKKELQSECFPESMKLLVEIAKEAGHEAEWIDRWSGGLVRINGKYFGSGFFPKYQLNSATSRQLVKDKTYAYMLLEEAKIKVPNGDYFFRFDQKYIGQIQGKGMDEARQWANDHGYPVFVKPNQGALGRNCFKVSDEEELLICLEKIFIDDYMVLVQEVLEGKEYRVMFVDSEIVLIYEKSRAYERVNGKKKYVSDVANLSSGGVLVGEIGEWTLELALLVKKIAQIFGLRYGGIDLMGGEINSVDDLTVLEVNSDPGLDHFLAHDLEKGKQIMKKLLQASWRE